MISNQVALLIAALAGFSVFLAGAKVMAKKYAYSLPTLRDNFYNPQVAGAFGIGLVLGIIFLGWVVRNLKPRTTLTNEWQRFSLLEKKKISSNTSLYRFRLPGSNAILGLPIGQHITIQADIGGKQVQRSYTPTSSDDDRGFFDLIIKTYPQGNISKYVDGLRIGEQIQVKGPKGQMKYHPELAREIGMIAGGTGFTPCLQIIRAALKNPADKTKIGFIYCNVNEEDILLKAELDAWARDHPDRFSVHYFLNNPPKDWNGHTGFITKEAIREYLPAPAKDIKVLMCGPAPMINACKKHLEELDYEKPRTVSKMEDQVFSF